MKRIVAMLAIAPGMASALTLAAPASDGAGAYATGKYRNLFLEAGHTETEVDARIARAFEQLFRGDQETQRLYFPSGENENGPLAYIPDIQHTDVRSEGMSYGMMIAVQLDRKAEFDALWNWSMTHMYQKDPRHPSHGFRLQAFFESQGLETYGDNWTLEGTVLRERHSPGLVSTNGVASLAATDRERARRFAEALWKLEVPSSHVFRYYDGLLYLMSLMHASGRFRIMPPPR